LGKWITWNSKYLISKSISKIRKPINVFHIHHWIGWKWGLSGLREKKKLALEIIMAQTR